MPRIRTIKPDFSFDEELSALPHQTRLFYALLWCHADKSGRGEDLPGKLRALIFPYEHKIDADKILTELHPKFVLRYELGGKRYFQVNNWEKHQRPHHTEPDSVIPPFKDGSATVVPRLDDTDKGKGKEGKGRERKGEAPSPNPELLLKAWNDGCPEGLPRANGLSSSRKTHVVARLGEMSIEGWCQVISKIRSSKFCLGGNDRGWRADFDWLIRPDTAMKVMEGKYDDKKELKPYRDPIWDKKL